jgi:Zn-dependent protease
VRRIRIPAGRVLGIRLWLHWSWFVVLGLVVYLTTVDFGAFYPTMPVAERLVMGIVTGHAFFACLAAHELAHAVVARRFGVRVRGITLFLFGGVAEIEGELPTPATEFAVALVGPATSVAIGSVFGLLSLLARDAGWAGAEGVLLTLALVNLGVTLFNLVPGLPLDGGRLLRAGIWRATGDFARATRVAAAGGQILAVVLAAGGTTLALTGTPQALWYVPMGVFVWTLARGAGRVRAPGETAALAFDRRDGHPSQPGPEVEAR